MYKVNPKAREAIVSKALELYGDGLLAIVCEKPKHHSARFHFIHNQADPFGDKAEEMAGLLIDMAASSFHQVALLPVHWSSENAEMVPPGDIWYG